MSNKYEIRRKIWEELEKRNIARFPRPVYGRIPNFKGAEICSKKLFTEEKWQKSKVVKVNPDSPQREIRKRALEEGKILIMPTPRIKRGFLVLDPFKIPKDKYKYASTISGAFKLGEIVEPEDLPRIDLIVIGSVAVDMHGNRIGKGGGYAELEYAILRELGKVSESTPIFTTVHDVQVLPSVPRDPYDLSVDLIITPRRRIEIKERSKRPKGIMWELLDEEKLHEIPILRRLYERAGRPKIKKKA